MHKQNNDGSQQCLAMKTLSVLFKFLHLPGSPQALHLSAHYNMLLMVTIWAGASSSAPIY
jgi:hypothetical protein